MTTRANINSAENTLRFLKSALHGVRYPASKRKIIKAAEQKGAKGKIIETLEHIGESDYFCAVDVIEEVKYISDTQEEYRNVGNLSVYGLVR